MGVPCYIYSVPPHSGPAYWKNVDRCKSGHEPCAICGKGIKNGTEKQYGIVTGGGDRWGESDDDGPGNMGCFPVGNDCHRKYVVRRAGCQSQSRRP